MFPLQLLISASCFDSLPLAETQISCDVHSEAAKLKLI